MVQCQEGIPISRSQQSPEAKLDLGEAHMHSCLLLSGSLAVGRENPGQRSVWPPHSSASCFPRVSREGTGTSNAFAAPSRGKSSFAQNLKLKRESSSAAEPKKVFLVQPKKLILPFMAQPQQYVLAYHEEPIKLFFPREEDTPPS